VRLRPTAITLMISSPLKLAVPMGRTPSAASAPAGPATSAASRPGALRGSQASPICWRCKAAS
jgi:hypothetical protein